MNGPHYDKISLLVPFFGPNGGTTFTDFSVRPKTLTVFGHAKTVTEQSKYYGSSGFFDGSGDYLQLAVSHNDFQFSVGDFTVEAWVRKAENKTQRIFSIQGGSPFNMLTLRAGSSAVSFLIAGNGQTQLSMSGGSLGQDEWAHVAATRQEGLCRLFLNGVQVDSGTHAHPLSFSGVNPRIGAFDATTEVMHGYIQDLRVTKGVALYTSNFTPPARLIGQISGTITDEGGAPAARKIVVFPRALPQRVAETESSGSGTYSLQVPAMEYCRIVLAQDAGSPGPADPVLPDLIDRVIAQ